MYYHKILQVVIIYYQVRTRVTKFCYIHIKLIFLFDETVWGQTIDTFRKAMSIVLLFKILGLIGDILFGYELLLNMNQYSNKTNPSFFEIFLIIFLLGCPRILHLPIITFGYGYHPNKEYQDIYYDEQDEDQLNHIYKSLWYGSLFLAEEYLEKLYNSTQDIKIGLIYFIILILESSLIFYVVILQSYVLPRDENDKIAIITAVSHYILIVWFVTSSFFGLLQNWYIWYKITSKVSLDIYLTDMAKMEEKMQDKIRKNMNIELTESHTHSKNDKSLEIIMDDLENDVYNDINNKTNIMDKRRRRTDSHQHRSICEIWSFCFCTIILNAFSFLMLVFSCCAGIGFIVVFSMWLNWNCQ